MAQKESHISMVCFFKMLNLYHANVPFLYTLKKLENLDYAYLCNICNILDYAEMVSKKTFCTESWEMSLHADSKEIP